MLELLCLGVKCGWPVVELFPGGPLLPISHCEYCVCLFMPLLLVLDEPAALVECGLNLSISMPACASASFIQFEMVAVVTGWWSSVFARNTFVLFSSLQGCVCCMYSVIVCTGRMLGSS